MQRNMDGECHPCWPNRTIRFCRVVKRGCSRSVADRPDVVALGVAVRVTQVDVCSPAHVTALTHSHSHLISLRHSYNMHASGSLLMVHCQFSALAIVGSNDRQAL